MSIPETSKAPDKAEKTPPQPDLGKIGDLKGFGEIMKYVEEKNWIGMIGAAWTWYKEFFGTPEEKKEIAAARKKAKEDKSTRDTKKGLRTLHENVDDKKKTDKKKAKEKKDEDVKVIPYKPGTKKPTVSPKSTFRAQVEGIYDREDTLFTTKNLHEYFGRNYKKFIIEKDPVTNEKPITFLGKPISGGINLMMLPFLKIAERNLMDQGLNYVPKQNEIRGFQDRNMCRRNKEGELIYDPNIPSFHKYGLAVDLDPDFNWPKDGRGTIPDEVIIAMAEAGFAVGNISRNTKEKRDSFWYLMNDTMHYQMRFPPGSAAGQKIIEASPIGRKYWKAVSPMLNALKNVA